MSAELAQDILKHQEDLKAKGIGVVPMNIKGMKTGKEIERSDFAGMERDVDALHSKENREVLEMAIAKISPWRDRRSEQQRAANDALDILDTIEGVVDLYIVTRARNEDITQIQHDLANIARDLNSDLGEYQEEIKLVLNAIAGTIRAGGGFRDIRQEISELQVVAAQDVKNATTKPEDTVTPRQYRLLLRLFGIKNYPERGTAEDPEIGEQGKKSRWATAGYPAVAGAEVGKEANAYLWYDIFEKIDDETGKPVRSVSDVYISRQRTEAIAKFEAVIAKMQQDMAESHRIDCIDYQLLGELRLRLCRMVIENVLPGGMRLIYETGHAESCEQYTLNQPIG